MDKKLLILFPYWLIFFSVISAELFIRKFKIIPTLKKYGRDYEDYLSLKKQKQQLEEYVKICEQYNLPSIYWKYMKISKKIGFVLVIGWFCLLFFIDDLIK